MWGKKLKHDNYGKAGLKNNTWIFFALFLNQTSGHGKSHDEMDIFLLGKTTINFLN